MESLHLNRSIAAKIMKISFSEAEILQFKPSTDTRYLAEFGQFLDRHNSQNIGPRAKRFGIPRGPPSGQI